MMMIRMNRYHKNRCHHSFLHSLLLFLLVLQPYTRMIMINAIQIGQINYHMEEQPYELQQLLFKVLQQSSSSSSLSHYHSAEMWMEIALWHEQQFQQLYETLEQQQEQEALQQHLSYAIHALQQVIANYESDFASTTRTTTKQQQKEAAAYYQLGEVYYLQWQLSSTSTTSTFSTSSLNNMLRSMEDAWDKSKHMYYNLLQEQEQQSQSKEDEDQLIHDPWLSIEYALVCIRQGVYQIETIGLTTIGSSSTSTTNTNKEVQAMFTRIQVGWDLLQTGLHYLEPAMKQFEQQQQQGGRVVGSEEIEMLQQQRLTAWYNSATAATLLGEFDQALQALQPVLEYYSSMLSNRHHHSSSSSSSSIPLQQQQQQQYYIYGEALKTQADLYLQLGQYELTKQAYQKAMDFFITLQNDENEKDEEYHYYYQQRQQQNQQHQQLLLDNDEWQESIQMYQNALEEYQQYAVDTLTYSPLSSSPSASTSNLHTLYERNDGYEGDLQATLGALYLTMGEMVLAEMHLRQAILLYRRANQQPKHHDEAYNRRVLADAHFNLAQLLFQQGEYSESAEQRRLACDLYHEILGEGINPMLQPEDEIPEEVMSMASHFTPTKLSTTNQQTEEVSAGRIIPMDEDQISQWKDNHTSTIGDEL